MINCVGWKQLAIVREVVAVVEQGDRHYRERLYRIVPADRETEYLEAIGNNFRERLRRLLAERPLS